MRSNISKNEQKVIDKLLHKKIPNYRQAYSDRTAWLMAYLAELAYIRFNPLFKGEKQKQYVVDAVEKLISKNSKNSLIKLIDVIGYDHNTEKQKLIDQLANLQMELIEPTFDEDGTQAMLISFSDYIVLAFRGTEATSIKDIKADAKAKSVSCESGGKVHLGFKEAYEVVGTIIQDKIDTEAYNNKPLFITGHSLGGALATIAAKRLNHQAGIAGCYTYGSPRVGDEEWIQEIKTPIYRVVNAADCVTMLPPSGETINLLSWLIGFIPVVGKTIRCWFLANLGGYWHGGDMRYLTNAPANDYSKVELLNAVSFFYRIKGFIFKKLPFKAFLSDHSISVYRKKLQVIGTKRNSD